MSNERAAENTEKYGLMRAIPNGLTGLVLKGLRNFPDRVCLKVKIVVLGERSPYYQYLAYVYIS
jgi:hypothetical protein